MPSHISRYISSLDGLRGLAILLVFCHHYGPHAIGSFGWTGVDLFFVLSGFLITRILYETRHAEGRVRSFYARRALRLFPVYCLACLIVIVGTNFLAGQWRWTNLPLFIYGANMVYVLHGTMTFHPFFDLSHFWSLATEEQFYSMWPLIVFLIPKRRPLIGICCLGMILAIAIRIAAHHLGWSPWFNYEALPARMDSLLAGGLLALGVQGPNPKFWLHGARLKWILGGAMAGLAGVIAFGRTAFFLSSPMNTIGFSLLAIVAACLIGLALIPGSLVNRVGNNAVLRFYGRYSYGLYVWHYLCRPLCQRWIVAVRSTVHQDAVAGLISLVTLLGLFTTIAVISFRWFEAPFLALKNRFVPGPKPVEHVNAVVTG
jgi:peptidoglycan/LPS O-acetylase OafA/YrhL